MRVLRGRMNLQNLHFKRHGREGPLRDCFQGRSGNHVCDGKWSRKGEKLQNQTRNYCILMT